MNEKTALQAGQKPPWYRRKSTVTAAVTALLALVLLLGTFQSGGAVTGPLTLVPPLAAILLAFLTQEVVSSLLLGMLCGTFLLVTAADPGLAALPLNLVRTASGACRDVVAVFSDSGNATTLLMCLAIGGLVGVINKTGGFYALAEKLTRRIRSPRSANLIGELLGMLIFFDDYANSLIIGPVMKPITDKLRMSREKLAYLVDSTAAPVAGIAVISSWVAVELSCIDSGLAQSGAEASAYSLFLGSIPFCFYNILCLAFILLSSLSKREFGPMLRAEVRARRGESKRSGTDAPPEGTLFTKDFKPVRHAASAWDALLPLLVLIVLSVIGFYVDGSRTAVADGLLAADAPFGLEKIRVAIGSTDTPFILFVSTMVASLVAILIGVVKGRFTFTESVSVWLDGVQLLVPTAAILILAWGLSGVVDELGTCSYIVKIVDLGVPYQLMPALIFAVCCAISFAAGSYGTMLIVMPLVVPVAYRFVEAGQIADPSRFVSLCVACVLSGSIFGDHCSPVTDTTILSSMGSGCDNLDHVRTQLPYAVTVAAVSMLLGCLPAGFGCPPLISLALSIAAFFVVLRVWGRDPDAEATRLSKKAF